MPVISEEKPFSCLSKYRIFPTRFMNKFFLCLTPFKINYS